MRAHVRVDKIPAGGAFLSMCGCSILLHLLLYFGHELGAYLDAPLPGVDLAPVLPAAVAREPTAAARQVSVQRIGKR